MNKLSGKSLLTLELVILLAFFLFGSVTCAVIFVKADKRADEAAALENAVTRSTSIAETLKSVNGNLSKTGNRISQRNCYDIVDGKLFIYFDENMQPVAKVRSTFTALVTREASGKCSKYTIEFTKNEDSSKVYSLEFKAVRKGASSK
ncbi:MAG: hypothetical protein Q4C80_01285 [Bacillota bacterium]|nr:hypothetical protein [Bacillota bacterium]